MDFIKKIAEIYKNSTVTLTFTFKDEDFSVLVSQKGSENDVLPFSVGGTSEELSDEKFFEVLEQPLTDSKEIIDNVNKVEKSLKDKEKKVKDKAIKKPSASKPEAKEKKEEQNEMAFD